MDTLTRAVTAPWTDVPAQYSNARMLCRLLLNTPPPYCKQHFVTFWLWFGYPGFIHSRKGEIAEMQEMPAAAGWLVHSPICTHLSRQKPMASVGIARRHLPFAIRNWQYRLAIHQKVLVPQGERKLSVPCPAEADLER